MNHFATYPRRLSPRQQLRKDLLEANRAFAGWFGLDPRYTMSSNIALAISRRTGLPFATAKLWFHGGFSGLVAAMLKALGMKGLPAAGIGALVWIWLESFDSSRRQQ
jgi:hypothetical protein